MSVTYGRKSIRNWQHSWNEGKDWFMKKLEKNNFVKKISVLFLTALIVCLAGTVFFQEAGRTEVRAVSGTVRAKESYLPSVIVYTALGDSIASGFGLEGYQASEIHSAKDAYREKVAEQLQGQYPDAVILADSLAVDGLDSTGLRDCLTNPENPEYEVFQEKVSSSNVITLSIGSNDILGPFMGAVAAEFGCSVADISSTLNEKISGGDFIELLSLLNSIERLNKLLAGLPEETEEEEMAEAVSGGAIQGNVEFLAACTQFEENLQVIIETIHTLAPEAEIYVTNIYNPYEGVSLTNPLTGFCAFSVGALSEFYIRKLNEAFLPDCEWYHLIDVNGAFSAQEKIPVNANIPDVFEAGFSMAYYNFDPHPTAEGHAIIASSIQKVMAEDTISARKVLPEKNTEFIAGNFRCRITCSDGESGEAEIIGAVKSVKKVVIPNTILMGDFRIVVTSIGKGAWKNDRELVSLTIGEQIKRIRKQAYLGCKNLRKISVKSEGLKKVGTRAFKNINKKAVFQFPKRCRKKYKKFITV